MPSALNLLDTAAQALIIRGRGCLSVPTEDDPVSTDDAALSSRRDFARAVALLAAAPLAAAAAPAAAQDKPPPKPEGPAGMAQALTEMIRVRYGKHLRNYPRTGFWSLSNKDLRSLSDSF